MERSRHNFCAGELRPNIAMQKWSRSKAHSFFVPGGGFLLGAALLAHSGWFAVALPSLTFVHYCAFFGGLLLAWRFHSLRIFCALIVMFLARQAISGMAHPQPGTATLLSAVSVLFALNLVGIALVDEHGVSLQALGSPAVLLFVEVVFVAVLQRSAETVSSSTHYAAASALPTYVLTIFFLAALILVSRALLTRKPADTALFWGLAAFFLSLEFGSSAHIAAIYSVAGMVVLAASVVETSYLLAYHDELTGLPSRRAFNDAIARLQPPFSMAAVDIDHFKRFNDTFGHDVGDQVLRLVASKLARVGCGGLAYRCGGEEFVILFPGKAARGGGSTRAVTVHHRNCGVLHAGSRSTPGGTWPGPPQWTGSRPCPQGAGHS
jgi:GGDEF domain-containing protein